MDFATPGYCPWKSYQQSELDMPGEFVESKIKYYKMQRSVYAKGGCGEIHIGVDPKSNMRVAIKKGYLKSQSTYGVSSTFIREIGFLKELSLYHHRNIVELVDVFPSDGCVYIVEKFYPSYIQQYLIGNDPPFTEEQIKYIIFSTAKALCFLKSCKLIHGDIKPANFLVSYENVIALTDFGSVRRCDDDDCYHSYSSYIIFSYYNAPEILLGVRKLTYAVDVWSLAITWLHILGVKLCDPCVTEIQMCGAIFQFLNENPSEETWPDLDTFQCVPRVETNSSQTLFEKLRSLIPVSLCSDNGVSLICSMLKLKPEERVSIEDICAHSYFDDCIYDKVVNGELQNTFSLPELSVLKKKAIIPPLVDDYFRNKKQHDGGNSTDIDNVNSPHRAKRVLRFDLENSVPSPNRNYDRLSISGVSFSMDENSIII